jgi:Icc-related predicted phosphoesterase
MKLLLFSDLHMDTRAAQRLVQMARDVDIVIGAGDFGNMRKGVSTCVDILKAIDRPSVFVPGNNESFDELQAACAVWPSAVVLHGQAVEIDGNPFFGIGGGIPVTPFGAWSFDLSEHQAATLLENCPDNAILISHSPPKGAVDISSSGQSLGSTAVRDAIHAKHPRLVVCGHIHASAGKQSTIGSTPVINAGPSGIVYDLSV